jgi:cellulose biosynthesis protein BcsQ
VVLVDLDSQGGVSHFLGLKPTDDVARLFWSVMFLRADRRPPITSFLKRVPLPGYPSLLLIKGHRETGEVEAELRQPGRPNPGRLLVEALAPLTNRKAIVVVDTGPYAGRLQDAVLQGADHVLVPGIPEGATEMGILKIAQRMYQLNRAITGLIPTRIVVTSRKHKETIMDWKRADGLGPLVYYDPPHGLVGIPQRVLWGQIYRTAKPIWDVNAAEVEASPASLSTARREMTTVLQRLAFDVGLRRYHE